MEKNLFEVAGTPEWTADNLRRMMKIGGSEENLLEWSAFLVEQIKLFLTMKDGKEQKRKEIIQIALDNIEKNITYIVKVYSLRQPLSFYRKYTMEPSEFESYIREYFYEKIGGLMEKACFEQEVKQNNINLENVIKRFLNNLKKMAIFAGHSEGEVRFPTENEEFVNLNDKLYQITIQVLDENVEALIKSYEILKDLYPEEFTTEVSEFDQKVSKYLDKEVMASIKKGIIDIKKKYRMFKEFESRS